MQLQRTDAANNGMSRMEDNSIVSSTLVCVHECISVESFGAFLTFVAEKYLRFSSPSPQKKEKLTAQESSLHN